MNAHSSSRNSPEISVRTHVAVVGDGVVGKATALGLAQAGLRVTLLTPRAISAAPVADAGWDARVYALNQTARDLLTSLRVWDALDATRVAPVEEMLVKGDATATAATLSFDAYAARVSALAWIVEDSNLHRALDAALRFASNIDVVVGSATGLKITDSGAQLQLDTGAVLTAELVVGADGGQSWVRGQCDIGLDYRSYGQRAVVGNFDTELPPRGIAQQWFSKEDGIVALLPLPQNRVSLVWSAPIALAQELMQGGAQQLADRLAPFASARLGKLTAMQPASLRDFPLALIKPHAIIAPRVALVGDAAHVIHPLAGHGMNLGFADAAALIRILQAREAGRDCGDDRLLRRYARVRKEEILLMQLATDGLSRLFETDVEPVRFIRNLGMQLVDRLPGLKQRLMAHALGNKPF